MIPTTPTAIKIKISTVSLSIHGRHRRNNAVIAGIADIGCSLPSIFIAGYGTSRVKALAVCRTYKARRSRIVGAPSARKATFLAAGSRGYPW
jgi:hypothetical protein